MATIFSYKNTLTIIFTFYCIRKRIPATKNAPILFAFVRPTEIFCSKRSLLKRKRSRFEAQKTHLLYKHFFYYFEHNLNEVECSAISLPKLKTMFSDKIWTELNVTFFCLKIKRSLNVWHMSERVAYVWTEVCIKCESLTNYVDQTRKPCTKFEILMLDNVLRTVFVSSILPYHTHTISSYKFLNPM